MLLRRATPLVLAVVAIACEPATAYDPAANNPSQIDYAVFDPQPDAFDNSPADIPLPNDLALQPSAIATQPAAQAEVLTSFAKQGGWPADQDLPITFDFVRMTIDPVTGASKRSAPPINLGSINAGNLIILSISAGGVAVVPHDTPTYATVGDHGVLTVPKKADAIGLRHWTPSVYAAAIKGGPSGILTTDGQVVNPRPAMYLITQGVDLTRPENQGLITCSPPIPCTREMKAAAAEQLETLRKAYLTPFAALAAAGFPTNEIANITAFTITSGVRVVADPVAAALGQSALPFPSDFLLDPVTHHLIAPAQDPVHGPFGPLGPALGTLDGFSTTALMTANTSGLIDPTTVNKDSVFLYEIGSIPPTAKAVRIPEAAELATGAKPGWAAASSALAASAGISSINVIALQPAIPVPIPGGAYPLPPLKEGTEYAVITTNKITEPGGKPTVQATLGRLLSLNNPLLVGTTPTVAGLKLADAQQLEPLRQLLKPILDDLATTKGVTRDRVTMVYTVRTQSGIKSTASLLASLPYSLPNSTLSPLATPTVTAAAGVAALMSAYGIDSTVTPFANIGTVVEATVVTASKLRCPQSPDPTAAACQAFLTANNHGKDLGFFLPSNFNPQPEGIGMLVSVPNPPYALGYPAGSPCIPTITAATCNVPLVIFRHGIGGGRGNMLAVANELNKAGFVVAAIDAAKHGDRSYCQATVECAAGSTCVPDPEFSGEGDAPLPSPGHCQVGATPADYGCRGGSINPSTGVCTTFCPTCTNTKAEPAASGNFVLGFNLFRTRDTFRQDIIDESQAIRLLSPNPACDKAALPTDPAHTCANNIITASTGVQIDPKAIYFTGQSLGSMSGVVDAAANPRVSKVALNVGGGTIVDVYSQGSFASRLNALLALQGLDKASNPSGYLQFLTVAKWTLDPAEPLNFASVLQANTLPFPDPTLNAIAPAPATRPTIGQFAVCDTTVPNAFNLELYGLVGLSPTVGTQTAFSSSISAPSTTCSTGGAVTHGFITDWKDYPASATGPITLQAQDDIAAFFSAGTHPPASRTFAP